MASLVFLLALLVEPAASAAPASTAAAAAESRTIVGEIVRVDVASRRVLIRESVKTTRVKGQPPVKQTVEVAVALDVPITRGKAPVALETLKMMDHVTARYVTGPDGAKAVSLRVAEAAPARSTAAYGSPAAAGN